MVEVRVGEAAAVAVVEAEALVQRYQDLEHMINMEDFHSHHHHLDRHTHAHLDMGPLKVTLHR